MNSSRMSKPPLLIGCGTGFAGDRADAAGPVVDTLIRRGGPACLMFETLAERTLAHAHIRRRSNPDIGYEPRLTALVGPILARCVANGIPIIGNFGAAHPRAAAERLQELAREMGLGSLRIAVIQGDDLSAIDHRELLAPLGLDPQCLVSANAYIGAQEIASALRAGAQIVVAGRVADSALALGPALAHFGWSMDDWDHLAAGTVAGHLLECGAQVSGGYFADPGYKDVPALHEVGFPIVELFSDGTMLVTKAENTGGCVTEQTVKEQLLYEIHDPANYLTPDVTADLSETLVERTGVDTVRVTGVRGRARPESLKVNAYCEGGWLAEGEISYAGPGAEHRARLAADILKHRLQPLALRCDLIGVVSLFGDDEGRLLDGHYEGNAEDVRLRVALFTLRREDADRLTNEVNALYTCGPAGGGGVRTNVHPRLVLSSGFVPRAGVSTGWAFLESQEVYS
jgi:hypothetical protein